MDSEAQENKEYSLRECSEITGYKVSSLRYFLRRGILHGVKKHRKIYIEKKEIMRFKNDYKSRKHSTRIKEN